jgi:hypothetical protein
MASLLFGGSPVISMPEMERKTTGSAQKSTNTSTMELKED